MKTSSIYVENSDTQWNWVNGQFEKLPKGDRTIEPIENVHDEWKAAKLAFQNKFHPLSDTNLTLAFAEYDKKGELCDFFEVERVDSREFLNSHLNGLTIPESFMD